MIGLVNNMDPDPILNRENTKYLKTFSPIKILIHQGLIMLCMKLLLPSHKLQRSSRCERFSGKGCQCWWKICSGQSSSWQPYNYILLTNQNAPNGRLY